MAFLRNGKLQRSRQGELRLGESFRSTSIVDPGG